MVAPAPASFSGGRLWRASPAGYSRNWVDVGEPEVEEVLPPAASASGAPGRVLQTAGLSHEMDARSLKVYRDAAVGSDNEMVRDLSWRVFSVADDNADRSI